MRRTFKDLQNFTDNIGISVAQSGSFYRFGAKGNSSFYAMSGSTQVTGIKAAFAFAEGYYNGIMSTGTFKVGTNEIPR